MIQNKFGELVFNEHDLLNLVMQGIDLKVLDQITVDDGVNTTAWPTEICDAPKFKKSQCDTADVEQWHRAQQKMWHMPDSYKQLDIAEHILGLCQTQPELQRCGQELLLYQERDLFDLLRYLKYLVDVMTTNKIIWGVGRGSSVASYVLYKLGVHRIDSMHYNLDIGEFLR